MIQRVVGSVVGFLGESGVAGISKTQKKNMSGVVILPVHFGQGLFTYSNFTFSYIAHK